MQEHEKPNITRDEIKKEFQLERMILFSDAVFAIVITLMAMEIKIPQSEIKITEEALPGMLLHLMPVLFAYMVSFVFIGVTWYNHLKIFRLLKDYDKGLVFRNLLLLFFVGLFPFSASVITRVKNSPVSLFIYIGIIMLCIMAQYLLYHYILVKRPSLRLNTDISNDLVELRKRKIGLISIVSVFVLIALTYFFIPDPELKSLSPLWMLLFPIVLRLTKKKK